MIFIPLLIALVLLIALFFGFLIVRKIIKQQASIAKERIRNESAIEKAKVAAQSREQDQKSPGVQYQVNSENFYAGTVGVVARDDAIVNRPNMPEELKRFCPNCGAACRNDDKFCSKCGKQL